MITPRSTAEIVLGDALLPSTYNGKVQSLCLEKCNTAHFFTLSLSPHESEVAARMLMSCWTDWVIANEVAEFWCWFTHAQILKSSAKTFYWQVRSEATLLMQIRNSIGPRTEPRGTPLITCSEWLVWPLMLTPIDLSERKSWIHKRMTPLILRHQILSMRMLWTTILKALLK